MTSTTLQDPLFIGVYPSGIFYADKSREVHSDYPRVAFLDFGKLVLNFEPNCPVALRKSVTEHAAGIQARAGQRYRISGAGQTVLLGAELPQTAYLCGAYLSGLTADDVAALRQARKDTHLVFLNDDQVLDVLREANVHNPKTGHSTNPTLALACGLEKKIRSRLRQTFSHVRINYALSEELMAPFFGKTPQEIAVMLKLWPQTQYPTGYLGMASYKGQTYGLRLGVSKVEVDLVWVGYEFVDPIGPSIDVLGASWTEVMAQLATLVDAAEQRIGEPMLGLPSSVSGVLVDPYKN